MSLKDYEDLVRDHRLLGDVTPKELDSIDFFYYYDRAFSPYEAAKQIRTIFAGAKKINAYI
jgi:hypothetical protein